MRVRGISVGPGEGGSGAVASARLEYADGFGEEVWFAFDGLRPEEVDDSGDPWLIGLLPLAALRGEVLEVEHAVDEALLHNARRILRTWRVWGLTGGEPELRAGTASVASTSSTSPTPVAGTPLTDGRDVATFFTGGVDSCFNLLHVNANLSERITRLVNVLGYDIPLDNAPALAAQRARLDAFADRFGATPCVAATNLRRTRFADAPWGGLSHGCALAMAAHFLRRLTRRVYLGADFVCNRTRPWGSNPMTTALYSGGGLEFVHYGTEYDRIAKTALLAEDRFCVDNLFVCWQSGGASNCGECVKCLRTMATLRALGRLDGCRAFGGRELSLERLGKTVLEDDIALVYFTEIADLAATRGDRELAVAIHRSVARSQRAIRWNAVKRRCKRSLRRGTLLRTSDR